jgi:uncharacterized caspase-like protein
MLWAGWPSLAHSQPPRRVALLIGNAAYTSGMPALTYPLQDIQVLEQSLKKLNFEVQVVRNADQKAMGRAIRDFGSAAREAQVALVYYSGHGMQARDENYLIPVGATIETEGDLDIEAIQLKALMRQIEDARPKTTVVVLDACRDNPVASRTKSGSKGLSRVQNQPGNTLVVFAAQAGATATDNGVFAKELATRIVEPNVGIRSVFDKVGQAVRQATGQKQSIQRDDQLSEDVVLLATARVDPVPVPPPAPVPTPSSTGPTAEQIEQQAWEAAQRANSVAVYNAYLAEYPKGRFASLARVALAGVQPASATPVSQGGASTQVPDGSGDPMYQLTRELTEDRLVQRGFAVGKQLRPMCTVRTKSGATCQLEAYVGGENTKDGDAYTCQKMDRSVVVSGCRDGFVEGLATLTVDGSKKAGKEHFVGVFLRGRPLYPLMHTYPGSADGTLLGITKSGSSFGCAYFPKWDSRDDTSRPECQFLSSAFGTYLMSRDGVDAVNAGKLDFSRVESNFQAWWRRSQ